MWKTIEDAPGVPPEAAAAFLRASARALATMVAGWLRVGFCQGNFNADNCLVGGRTMDYGPFGFVDKARPRRTARAGPTVSIPTHISVSRRLSTPLLTHP